ncbi:hypothetical protein ACP86_16430 [Marinobacter sp. CP1]|jgi:GNAT superfamily N-acetyltransferase|uniref:hypothetical protein n=1 Tax=unclassified Marinobacter TaxID=83889 RepID=UPI00069D6603|nr:MULTISPECIES: hypothetical protein [unclassified Marinobacter]AKV97616.1 hypothetical protein ACP86_16430 [Marinobacter sp. CP1]
MNLHTKLAAIVVSSAVLTACGEVGAVKDAPFIMEQTITVGKALENRPICEDTSWSEETDQYDRTIVEYRCRLKGSEAYFSDTDAEYAEEYFRMMNVDEGMLYADGGVYIIRENGEEVTHSYLREFHRKEGVLSKHMEWALEEVLAQKINSYEENTLTSYLPRYWPDIRTYKKLVNEG